VLFQIGGVQQQIGLVVLVKQLDLVAYVPDALVARCSGQQATTAAGRQERLQHLVSLRIGMTQIVALVEQQDIAVPVLDIVQQKAGNAIVVLAQVINSLRSPRLFPCDQ
jgi:hypothetical protein